MAVRGCGTLCGGAGGLSTYGILTGPALSGVPSWMLAGRRLLLTGASGGVGHYLVELAAAVGATVTAVTSTPARGERLLALGPDAVVTSVEHADARFDVAIDSVGGDVFGQALLKLGGGGLMLWYGQASLEPATADFFAVQRGPVDVTIRTLNYWTEAYRDREDLATLVDLVATGRMHRRSARSPTGPRHRAC